MIGRKVGARERLKQLFSTPPREWYRLRPTFSRLGEDFALVRLLQPRTQGIYVDVGANDPINESNTAYL